MPIRNSLGAVNKIILDVPPIEPGFMLGNASMLDAGFQWDKELQETLDDICISKLPALRKQAFAIVDLSSSPKTPKYAGRNDRRHVFVASLAKLLALFAAYQLRMDVRVLSIMYRTSDMAQLSELAHSLYSRTGACTTRRPQIANIIDVHDIGVADFKQQMETDDALDEKHTVRTTGNGVFTEGTCPRNLYGFLRDDSRLRVELKHLPFREQLRLMVGWSDNVAAGVCIQAIGYPYLWALSRRSGLYRIWDALPGDALKEKEKSGLYLSSDYSGGPWLSPPVPHRKSSSQAACARSIACMLTLMARDELIGPASSASMREMLQRAPDTFEGRGEYGPIGAGLAAGGMKGDIASSKIGLFESHGRVLELSNAIICRASRWNEDPLPQPAFIVVVALCNDEYAQDNKPLSTDILENLGAHICEYIEKKYRT